MRALRPGRVEKMLRKFKRLLQPGNYGSLAWRKMGLRMDRCERHHFFDLKPQLTFLNNRRG